MNRKIVQLAVAAAISATVASLATDYADEEDLWRAPGCRSRLSASASSSNPLAH